MADRQVKFIAHRGWSRRFPENSLPALAAAAAVGADEIEFDLRMSKDGIPFLCHDEDVGRVSNLVGRSDSFTMQELERADIKAPDGTLLDFLGFTRVDEVFRTLGGRIGMNVHIKDSARTKQILTYITDTYDIKGSQDIYVAGDATMLEIAREFFSDIPRCCLAEAQRSPEILLERALEFECVRLQFRRTNYTKEAVARATKAGLIPNLYYADDVDGARQAMDYGIIGLLTNDVGLLKKHFSDNDTIRDS